MTIGQDPDELPNSLRNAMMIFVAKFLVAILPPLIVVFFYILTITKDDIRIAATNEITKIKQIHQSSIAHMKALHEKIEQSHQKNVAEMGLLHKKIKTCRKDCNKNLELKISERTNISERFKMNFNVDKKRVEFKFEEVK